MKCNICGTELEVLFTSTYCPKGCKDGVLGTQFQWRFLGTIKSIVEHHDICPTLGQGYSFTFEELRPSFIYFKNSIILSSQGWLSFLVDYPDETGSKFYFSDYYDKYAIAPKKYTWQDGEFMIASLI